MTGMKISLDTVMTKIFTRRHNIRLIKFSGTRQLNKFAGFSFSGIYFPERDMEKLGCIFNML